MIVTTPAKPGVPEAILRAGIGPLVTVSYAPQFRTHIVHHTEGRVLPGSAARLLLFHGMGSPSLSHAGTMANNVGELTTRTPANSTVLNGIAAAQQFLNLSAEAFGVVGHKGSDVDISETPDFESLVRHHADYVRAVHAETPELPLFLLGRSASGLLVDGIRHHLNQESGTNLVRGIILVSAMFAGNSRTLTRNTASMREKDAAEGVDFDTRIDDWVATWYDKVSFQPSGPTLIMTSPRDRELINEERALFDAYVRQHPDIVKHLEIMGEHNLIKADRKFNQARIAANFSIFIFMNRVLRGETLSADFDLANVSIQESFANFFTTEQRELAQSAKGRKMSHQEKTRLASIKTILDRSKQKPFYLWTDSEKTELRVYMNSHHKIYE